MVFRRGCRPANAVKIAANSSTACAIESMAEASALVKSYGIAVPDFIELLTHTLYPSPVYKGYGAMIAEQRFSPVGSSCLKEVRLALSAGEANNLPLPFGSVLRDSMIEAIAQSDGHLD